MPGAGLLNPFGRSFDMLLGEIWAFGSTTEDDMYILVTGGLDNGCESGFGNTKENYVCA
jgi:hypothetical protein